MLTSNSDLSSSIFPSPPAIPNSVETLGESPSPTASIGAHAVQSLALSSPIQDRDDPKDSIPPRSSDGNSSSSLIETLIDGPQAMPESQVQIGVTSQAHEMDDDDIWSACRSEPLEDPQRWTPNVSPGYDTDDYSSMECSQSLLRFKHDSPNIAEPSGVGVGLWNLGNTCFINSVLQCFTHTVPLIKSLSSYDYQRPCNCSNEWFCVLRALRGHIEAALTTSFYPLYPFLFVNNLNYFSPDFHRYQQEDAHEFLQAFLDKLERCCLDRSSDRGGDISSQDVNIVDHVFGGRLVSKLRCCNCNSVSETFENSVGLSLEIEDVDDLWSALDSFTRVEKLDEQLTCENCNEKVPKEKQLLLDKLPLVATLHLKRFKNNGLFMEKIFKHVRFPLELDLQPYTSSSQNEQVATKYYLYAIVEHLGLLAYGHYSSYVRSAPETWHKFNDQQVTRIDEESVLSQDPYILFYAREGTPWLSGDFEEMQPWVDSSLQKSSPKSVLDPTNGECLSDISYEGVNKSTDSGNPQVKTEENLISLSNESNEDVFLSATESSASGEDCPMAEILNPFDADDDSYKPCIERATAGDEFVPLLTAQNQDSSLKQQEGVFKNQIEHLDRTNNDKKELSQQPLLRSEVTEPKEPETADGDLKKKPLDRGRELKQAIYKTASPPKKLKTE